MQDLVIFDLSGTLVMPAHRTCRDDLAAYRDAILKDEANATVAAVFYDHFTASRDLWIVSTRSESVREATEDWLYVQGIYCNKLLLRPPGDTRSPVEVKLRWLHDGTIPRERVLCAYEDDLDVVNMYRAEGIPCFHVRPAC